MFSAAVTSCTPRALNTCLRPRSSRPKHTTSLRSVFNDRTIRSSQFQALTIAPGPQPLSISFLSASRLSVTALHCERLSAPGAHYQSNSTALPLVEYIVTSTPSSAANSSCFLVGSKNSSSARKNPFSPLLSPTWICLYSCHKSKKKASCCAKFF